MKKYSKLLKSVNQRISETERQISEEETRIAFEEENAPTIDVSDIEEADDITLQQVNEDTESQEIHNFLNLPLIQKAIEYSDFHLYMEENYDGAVFDIMEASYIFNKDFNVGLENDLNECDFSPSPIIKNYVNLDEMAKEFYKGLEQAYEMGI